MNQFVDSVLFPLFNHGTQRRDEYLFLDILRTTLENEVVTFDDMAKLVVNELLAPKIAVKFVWLVKILVLDFSSISYYVSLCITLSKVSSDMKYMR